MSKIIAKNDFLIKKLIKDPRYRIYKNGKNKKYFIKHGTRRLLLRPVYQGTTSSGYAVITYKNTKLSIHRIVYFKFNKKLNSKLVINHKNHNKKDNRLINLEMISLQQNSLITYLKGKNSTSKLNINIVNNIRKLNNQKEPINNILKKYSISIFIFKRIINNKTWNIKNKIIKSKTLKRNQALELIIKDLNYVIKKNGFVYSKLKVKNKLLKLDSKSKTKFKTIKYKKTTLFVHRIIARKFISKIKKGYIVNHKDGNQTNNKLSNLEIMTQKENMIHSSKVLKKISKKMLTKDQVLKIRLLKKTMTIKEIADLFNIGTRTVSYICSYSRYKEY